MTLGRHIGILEGVQSFKLLARFRERGVDECLRNPEPRKYGRYVVPLPLDHAEKEQVVFRIYPEPGAPAAAPKDAPRCYQHAERRRILYDAKIKAAAQRRTAEGRETAAGFRYHGGRHVIG